MEEKANNIFESSSQSDFEIKQQDGFFVNFITFDQQAITSICLTY